MLTKEDVVIAISNNGETRELLEVLPLIKRYGNRMITLTGNVNSSLAKAGDVCLNIYVKEEACPLGLAPTTSTTATLALGDALAAKAVQRMEEYSITSLFVFNQPGDKAPVGVIHLHDLLKAGVV